MTAGRFGPSTGHRTSDQGVEVIRYPAAGPQFPALAAAPSPGAQIAVAAPRGVAAVRHEAPALAVYERLCADTGWTPA